MTFEEFDARSAVVNGALLKKLPLILDILVAAIVVIYECARHLNGASVKHFDLLCQRRSKTGPLLLGVIIFGGAFGLSAIMSRLINTAISRAGLVCPACNSPLGSQVKAVRQTCRCLKYSHVIIESNMPAAQIDACCRS